MIDIHCHILPSVDDGPATMEDSMQMIKEAVNEGITTIIATPHHKNNQYTNPKVSIIKGVEALNREIHKLQLPIQIVPGQEVRIYGEIIDDYKKGEIQTLADTKYVFIEFPSSSVPRYSERLLYDIQTEGLIPVIVHPERNKQLQENPDQLYQFVKNGTLTQVTASSVAGYFGKTVKRFSEQLIQHNLTHFVASDAHNTHNRGFKLREAFDIVDSGFGVDYTYLLTENSEILLGNQSIMKEIPEPIKKRKFLGIF